jgi:hypothetical protein
MVTMNIVQCMQYIIDRDFKDKINWDEPVLFQVDSEEIDHISQSLLNIARCGIFDIGDVTHSPEETCYKYTIHALQTFEEFCGKKDLDMVAEDHEDFVLIKLNETMNSETVNLDKIDDLKQAILKRRKDLFKLKEA